MDFWIFFGVVALITIIVALVQRFISNCNQDDEHKNDMEELIAQLDDFSVTQRFFGYDNQTGIAIDENRKKVCLINNHQEDVSFRVYSYRDLLSAEIFKDGLSLTKTIRSNQIGGVLLGGFLLGSVGAIIGGLSETTEASKIVNRVDLRLIINDTTAPIHDISFLELTVDRNDPEYKVFLATKYSYTPELNYSCTPDPITEISS